MIDLDSFIPGVQDFRFRDALFLQRWNCFLYPSPGQYKNILKIAQTLQAIKNRYGKPTNIHSWLRIEPYTVLIGGSPNSWHHQGGAIDFNFVTVNCDEVREDLKKYLVHYQIRLENKPGSPWLHIDNKPIADDSHRFFVP